VTSIPPEVGVYFRDQLRRSRAAALLDAEAWHGIVVVLEQLGAVLSPGASGLGAVEPSIRELAERSALAADIPEMYRHLHTPFADLYRLVRRSRNAALHEGAFARRLTTHAVELSLIVEDALSHPAMRLSDYMVRDPVQAAMWQPISFVRQAMLVNSFSYLPVWDDSPEGAWHLVSDIAIARFLHGAADRDARKRLGSTLRDAVKGGRVVATTRAHVQR
jgi:hypothetical protein